MKIIEAMKKIKDLHLKAKSLRDLIIKNHANLSYESPVYGDNQREKVREFLQAHGDVVQEIAALKHRLTRTNTVTSRTIMLGGKAVTKTLDQWVHRRKELASLDFQCWSALNDRGLKEGNSMQSDGQPMPIKIVRHYDPQERDARVELYRSEPSLIDAELEIANAMTDLV